MDIYDFLDKLDDELGLNEQVPSKHPGIKGLSAKKRSELVKKAKRKEDIGKPGKRFKEVAAKAAKRYGSEESGKRVAAAAMWKAAKNY